MKIKLLYLLIPALSLLLATGCVKDIDTGGGHTDEVKVTLTLKLPATASGPQSRAITPTPGEENQIDNIVILALTQKGSGWVYDYTAENITWSKTINALTATATVKDKSSPQQFVILLNAENELQAVNPQRFQDIEEIERGLVVDLEGKGEWPARINGTGDFKPIPMYARTGAVTVSPNGGSIGNYNLIRMVARINVTLHSDIDISDFMLAEACLFNYKTAGYISYGFSEINQQGDAVTKAAVPENNNTGDPILGPNEIYEADYVGDQRGQILSSIYTFESPAITSDAGRLKGTALVVGGYYDGNTTDISYYRIDLKTTDDTDNPTNISSPLLRNHSYNVEIQSVNGSGYTTPEEAYKGSKKIEVEITQWSEGGNMILDQEGKNYLWLSDLEFSVDASAQNFTMNIETDAAAWTAVISEDEDDPGAGGASWLTVSPASGNGAIGLQTLTMNTEPNPHPFARTGYIHITADGRIDAVVTVTQKFGFDLSMIESLTYAYVGAFWRANQTGERLIRIHRSMNGSDIDDKWTATVVEGEDWIMLDKEPTADGNIYTASTADMITSDGSYQLDPSTAMTSVSGDAGTTEDIYFRIGLRSTYTPTKDKPARYGLVVLTYHNNEKSHAIFIRQGEEADYLMRPQDPIGNGTPGGINRSTAVRFSPYNLTAPGYKNNTAPGGSNVTDHPDVGARGGVFVDYPTQAGAYFQWANATQPRRAYHPTNPGGLNTIIGWQNDYPDTYWSDLSSTHETCPTGYRRPHDGVINGPVANNTANQVTASEMRMSLWHNPQMGTTSNMDNSLWGFYADGFFDRNATVVPDGATANTNAVAVRTETTDAKVAYIGRLFYNPYNNASIFLPTPGIRNGSSGGLGVAGSQGYFWPASAAAPSTAWYLVADASNVRPGNGVRNNGFTVRCVKDEEAGIEYSIAERFAKSNIVMLDVGLPTERLAFATARTDNYSVAAANVQGMLFKYGSLIGINTDALAEDKDYENDFIKFIPHEYENINGKPATYLVIPYYIDSNGSNDEFIAAYPGVGYEGSAAVGDICRYISDKGWVEGKWRMPTALEMQELIGSPIIEATTGAFSQSAINNETGTWGTHEFTSGRWLGSIRTGILTTPPDKTLFLPVTGQIVYNTGQLIQQGFVGYYWTSSIYEGNGRYVLLMDSILDIRHNSNRQAAYSIRCIRE